MAELRLSAVLQVVLRITMDDTKSMPAIGFDENTIKFLSNVGAFIDVDTYRNDT
jgi:glutaredoxin-related protein